MKKIILLFVLSVSLFSCSKDDAAPAKVLYANKIVGTWETVIVTNRNTITNVVEDVTPECPTKYVFTGATSESSTSSTLSSGNHSLEYYGKNGGTSCALSSSYNGAWTNTAEGVYKVLFSGQTVQDTYNVIFTNNYNSMTLTEQAGPNNILTYGLAKK